MFDFNRFPPIPLLCTLPSIEATLSAGVSFCRELDVSSHKNVYTAQWRLEKSVFFRYESKSLNGGLRRIICYFLKIITVFTLYNILFTEHSSQQKRIVHRDRTSVCRLTGLVGKGCVERTGAQRSYLYPSLPPRLVSTSTATRSETGSHSRLT